MAVSGDHMRRSSYVHVLLEARFSCFLMFGEEFCLRKIGLYVWDIDGWFFPAVISFSDLLWSDTKAPQSLAIEHRLGVFPELEVHDGFRQPE